MTTARAICGDCCTKCGDCCKETVYLRPPRQSKPLGTDPWDDSWREWIRRKVQDCCDQRTQPGGTVVASRFQNGWRLQVRGAATATALRGNCCRMCGDCDAATRQSETTLSIGTLGHGPLGLLMARVDQAGSARLLWPTYPRGGKRISQ